MKVFVTDGDNRAALAITRSLGARGHQVIVGEKRAPSLAGVSRFSADAVVYPDPVIDSDRFVDFLVRTIKQRGVEVVLPVADITTFLVTENRDQFEPHCAVPFASAEVVRRAANKVDIVQTAKSLGVPVPQSAIVCKPDCLPAVDVGFPVVVKPRQSRVRTVSGWQSTTVSYARDADELKRDLQSRGAHEFPLMLQECITGPGVGVFACYHGGRPSALFSHWRIRERPPWGGVSVLSQSTEIDPLARDYAVRLLDAIGWHGVAMVEFKRDQRDGVPKLMEINGRFWGSLQLAIDAGVDFPRLLVDGVCAERMPPPQPYTIGVRNRWLWGDVDTLLLTLFGGHIAPKGHQPRRVRSIVDFLEFWSRDLHYENPKWGDLRPWFLETRRWIGKGLGEGRRDAGSVAPNSEHGVARLQSPRVSVVAPSIATSGLHARIDDAWLAADRGAAWNALLPRSGTHSVFQTHEWNRSWWETFGEQYEPCTVAVTGADGLAGIAPLVIARQSLRDRVVRFIGDGRSDYCDFLSGADREAAIEAMLGAVFSGVDWDLIELNNVPSESPTIPIVQSICERAGYRILVSDQFVCPTLIIEGREEDARAILNKRSLRRPTNFFQRAGRLTCRDLTRASEIEPYLTQFFEQHVGRWKGTHSPSLFLDERNRSFYRAVTRNFSDSGVLLFSVIELDGAPIAFHYGFDHDGVVIWYKPSFDIKHAAHSPGLVLMRHLIGHAVNGGRRELDFTVGDEAFKHRFTNETRTTACLRIFRRSSGYLFDQVRRHMRRATVRAVKRGAATIGGGRSER